ncbi:MAG: hypothetical protein A2V81_00735 [Candidatus Abawacabacteria bacterium RBG_16_42_10]|uniref:Uncharacterized protein n=1 Tax=Candidatus Abawacabacteria bacterium RBG_16_42_10 TaxID=1817814 RepID=A0A1F4XHY0_9BACT|nr:MAG: hypothetical protein A2V81_00735 [Candidatus Abawacabacteria bacterium RBG_16_42_10]
MRHKPPHAFGRRDHTGREDRAQKLKAKAAETLHETAFSVFTIEPVYPDDDTAEAVIIITKTISYLGILDGWDEGESM